MKINVFNLIILDGSGSTDSIKKAGLQRNCFAYLLLVVLLCSVLTQCNKPVALNETVESPESVTNHESHESFIRLYSAKIDSIFEADSGSEHTALRMGLNNLFKDYIDSLFITELKNDEISSYDSITLEFEKEKWRKEKIYIVSGTMAESTFRMEQCNVYLHEEELFLLDKYYKLALSALKPEDKPFLVEDQKLWEKSYESSRGLIRILLDDKYTGGGTMWSLSSTPEYIMDRVESLFWMYSQASKFS
jgi:hypothetical protein